MIVRAWLAFWTFALVFGGCAFAVVTIIVTYKGVGEVRQLIRDLNIRNVTKTASETRHKKTISGDKGDPRIIG